jgi:hypothetical protein
MVDKPSITKLIETIAANKYWFSLMWLKIKSSPTNVGVIGKPVNPKHAIKNANAIFGWSKAFP